MDTAGVPTQTVATQPRGAPHRRLQPGAAVAGRYEIVRVLGAGGYGVVYLAHDRRLKQDIALKVLRPDRLTDASRIRLRREVRLARTVVCPHLVCVFDLGHDGELTWISMELVEGETLRGRLRRGRTEPEAAVRIAADVLRGLEQLHEHGVVHRDVKPGNILLAADGSVKLGDFGLARRWDRDETRATDSSSLVGTVEYASPEQVLGREVGPRSDLYSLGVVLFEMLAGRRPHEGTSVLGTVLAHLRQPAEDVRRHRAEAPAWLAAVVARLLAKDPADRFATASDALTAIAEERHQRFLFLRRRRVRRWLPAVLVALVAVAGLGRQLFEQPPLPTLRYNSGGQLKAVAADGRELWRRQLWGYTTARLRHGQPPRILGFLPRSDDPTLGAVDRLLVFDQANGQVIDEISLPTGDRLFVNLGFSATYECSLRSEDLDEDGVDEVFGRCVHKTQWPSYAFLYEPRHSRTRLLLTACGHHDVVGHADLDGDGELEVLLFGINNCYGWKRGLAAVKLDPPIHQAGSPRTSATAPGDLFAGHAPSALLWYVLLPTSTCAGQARCVEIDPEHKLITVAGMLEGSETIGFDGFRTTPTTISAPAAEERRQHRRGTYRLVYRARRQLDAGSFAKALGELRQAALKARIAGDDQLREWIARLTGHGLALSGHKQEAQELFRSIASSAESSGDVDFEAATAFHLAGHLDLAAGWYRRALEADPFKGRFDFEPYIGLILALVERGDWERAEAEIERFAPLTQPLAPASCRAYVQWRRGRRPELPYSGAAPQGTYDLFRYWNLEFRRDLGEELPTLLPAVAAERGNASEEYRGLVRALEADLLAQANRLDEALRLARQAHRLVRADLLKHPVARAHYDIVAQRRAAIERAAGYQDEAARVEEELRHWQARKPAPR